MSTLEAAFAEIVAANLAYWQARCQKLTDAQIQALAGDCPNIIRAVQLGLVAPQTEPAAADLTLLAFPLMERVGQWYAWLALLGHVLSQPVSQEPSLRFKLLNRQGVLLRYNWQLEAAIAVHQQAYELACRPGERRRMAEAHFQLGEDYRLKRAFEMAEAEASAALQIFVQLDDTQQWTAAALHTLGLIAWEQGQLAEAKSRLEEAVEIWRPLEDTTELARALNSLGLVLHAMRDFSSALACYQQALVALTETASELDRSKVQNNLGRLFFDVGNYAGAEAAFRQADSAALRQSGDFFTRAALLQNLGNAMLKQGGNRLADAMELLEQAVGRWQQLEEPLWLANSQGTLAEAQARQGQWELAGANYRAAIALLRSLPTGPEPRNSLLQEFIEALKDLNA